MDGFKSYISYIDKNGINGAILNQIINEHAPVADYIRKAQERYSTNDVPILKRVPHSLDVTSERMKRVDNLINNKLNNAHDADIVDTKIGYVLGHPINYVVDKDIPNYENLANAYENLITRVNMPDKDMTLGKQAAIAGYGARLVYWAVENGRPTPRVTNIDPAECIFLYHESMVEPSYAIQYYAQSEIKDDGTKERVSVAEFHDSVNTYLFATGADGYELKDIIPHYYNSPPLFGFENNDELQSDAHKVLNLVDAYDRTMSDVNSEIEAMRLAILILRNIGMDEDDIQSMQKAGVLEMWGAESDVKYLTKDVNDTMVQNSLDRIEKNITKFAKSVDFSDEAFAGNISGIALKFKTLTLEWKSIKFEQKFRSTLTYQSKLLCSAWSLLNICSPEDYLSIWYAFKRSMPSNMKEEAEITSILQGRVSERTRLSLLTFIDDVDHEIEQMEAEALARGEKLPDLDDDDGFNAPEDNSNADVETSDVE